MGQCSECRGVKRSWHRRDMCWRGGGGGRRGGGWSAPGLPLPMWGQPNYRFIPRLHGFPARTKEPHRSPCPYLSPLFHIFLPLYFSNYQKNSLFPKVSPHPRPPCLPCPSKYLPFISPQLVLFSSCNYLPFLSIRLLPIFLKGRWWKMVLF